MLGGINTNVRHRGVVFHVQTEDSGRASPRLVTHVYHQGTILASDRHDYRDRLDEPDLPRLVRGLLDEQHHGMVRRLRAGAFDDVIRERLGPNVFGEGDDPPLAAPVAESLTASGGPPVRTAEEAPLDEIVLDWLVERARKRQPAPR